MRLAGGLVGKANVGEEEPRAGILPRLADQTTVFEAGLVRRQVGENLLENLLR